MELRARHIVAADESRHRAPVIGRSDDVSRMLGRQMIGMHEIGVQPIRASLDTLEQRMCVADFQRIPADLGNLEPRIRRRHFDNITLDPSKSVAHGFFQPAGGHELHADADAEEGVGLFFDGFDECLMHAGNGIQTRPAIGIGADTGQDDAVRRGDVIGLVGQIDGCVDTGFTRGALESFGGRAQIARAVVDDRDTHVSAFHSSRKETIRRDR